MQVLDSGPQDCPALDRVSNKKLTDWILKAVVLDILAHHLSTRAFERTRKTNLSPQDL